MLRTPNSNRLHIGLFGRRNVGKSALLHALTRQDVSIVSDVAGTTTDPVEKPMELQPLGPVVFVDTAGVDDLGALGELRVARTRRIFDRTDLAIVVTTAGAWGPFEDSLLAEFKTRKTATVVVLNKTDLARADHTTREMLAATRVPSVLTSATRHEGLSDLREAIIRAAPDDFLQPPPLVGDLVAPGSVVILVTPIDKEAPKGRLILPQVQTIRDLLDNDAMTLVVKERELAPALERLKDLPALVVTDSQAFLKVSADTPPEVPMTSFSILFARQKGDLVEQVRGALAIEQLRPGDRVLVCEACSHHPIADDIGRVKIPRWLTQYVGGALDIVQESGHNFRDDLSSYRVVIHCGACVQNRREMISRIARCRAAGVPITNCGLTIAYTLGIFERALSPFPAALDAYHESMSPAALSVVILRLGLTQMNHPVDTLSQLRLSLSSINPLGDWRLE
jgi:[FeFe] hydrogenase H-cluster maturation GTPase HydF